jgi:phosphoglycerol geranylgeranyltransferase
MSLLNSKDRRYLIEEQARGARFVKESKLEVIPLGYIVIDRGQKVGEVGKVEITEETDTEKITGYALAAQLFGMRAVYLEKGSGADKPIAKDTISEVKKAIDVPLIIGGGVRTPEQAREISEAGADYIVTGTLMEETPIEELCRTLRKLIEALQPLM